MLKIIKPTPGPQGPPGDPGKVTGAGSPEGVVAAPVGTIYTDDQGGAGTTLWVKESGTGSTGWASK